MKHLSNSHRQGTTSAGGLNTQTQKNVVSTKNAGAAHSTDRNTITTTISSNGMGISASNTRFLQDYRDHITNCVMVDTLDLELPCVASTPLLRSYGRLDHHQGLIADSEWAKGDLRASTGKQSLRVRHVAKTNKLLVEGSNAMHYQGHNVVSSGDVTGAAYAMLRAVKQDYKLPWVAEVGYYLAHGHLVEVTRIDVALLLLVPEGVTKANLINALAFAGIRNGINIGLYFNESVYFDQSSQLESQKFYDKAVQVARARKGGLPNEPGVDGLIELNEKTIRLEAVFRKKRLVSIAKQYGGRPHPCLFSKAMLADMVLAQLQRYARDGQVTRRLNTKELLAIPLPYRSTVAHWQNGMDLAAMVKSDRVLQEHANYLRRNHNIDLFGLPPNELTVPMPLSEILSPESFIPVPPKIRQNTRLFFEEDMDAVRSSLRRRIRSGIGSVLVDPYRPPEMIVDVNGELLVV